MQDDAVLDVKNIENDHPENNLSNISSTTVSIPENATNSKSSIIETSKEFEDSLCIEGKITDKKSEEIVVIESEELKVAKLTSIDNEALDSSSNSSFSSSSSSTTTTEADKIEEMRKRLCIENEQDKTRILNDSDDSISEIPVPPKPVPIIIDLELSEGSESSSDSYTSTEESVQSYRKDGSEIKFKKRKAKARDKSDRNNKRIRCSESYSSVSDSENSITESEDVDWSAVAWSQINNDTNATSSLDFRMSEITDNNLSRDVELQDGTSQIIGSSDSVHLGQENPIREYERKSVINYSNVTKKKSGDLSETSLIIDERLHEEERLLTSREILERNNEKDKGKRNDQNSVEDDTLIINAEHDRSLIDLIESRATETSDNRKRSITDSEKKSKHRNSPKKFKSSDHLVTSSSKSPRENEDDRYEERNSAADCLVKFMNNELEYYYRKSWGGERFDIDAIRRQMPMDPRNRDVLNEDSLGNQQRTSRHCTDSKCRNCKHTGHHIAERPEKRELPSCHICSTPGHREPHCPHEMCLGTSHKNVNTHLNVEDVTKPQNLLSCNKSTEHGHGSTTCDNKDSTLSYGPNYTTRPTCGEDGILESVEYPSKARDRKETENLQTDGGVTHKSLPKNEGRKIKSNTDKVRKENTKTDEFLHNKSKATDKNVDKTSVRLKEHRKSNEKEIQKSIKPLEVRKGIKPREVQESIKPMEVQKSIKPPKIQKSIKPMESQKSIKTPEIQKNIKPPEIQKNIKPLEIQKSMKPLETQKSSKPTAIPKSIKPSEIQKSIKPLEIQKSSKPPEIRKSSKPPEIQKSIKPREIQKSIKPLEIPKSSKPLEISKTSKPPEIQKNIKPSEIRKSTKPPETQRSIKPLETQKSSKSLEIPKSIKPREIQKSIKPLEIQKSIKSLETQKSSKPPEIPKSIKPPEIQKRIKPLETQKSSKPLEIPKSSKPLEISKSSKPTEIQKSIKPLEIQKSIKPLETQKSSKPPEIPKSIKPPEIQKSIKPLETQKSSKPPEIPKSSKPPEIQKNIKPPGIQKTIKPMEIKKSSKPPEIQKNIKPPEIQKTIKPMEIQKSIRPLAFQTNIKPLEIQKSIKPPEIQKSIKPPEIQKTIKPMEIQKSIKPMAFQTNIKPLEIQKSIKPPEIQKSIKPPGIQKTIKPMEIQKSIQPLAFQTNIQPLAFQTNIQPLAFQTNIQPLAFQTNIKPPLQNYEAPKSKEFFFWFRSELLYLCEYRADFGEYRFSLLAKTQKQQENYDRLSDSLSHEFFANLTLQFPIRLEVKRCQSGEIIISIRSIKDLHEPMQLTIMDWLSWEYNERYRFVKLNLPTSKEDLVKLLTEKLNELKQELGDPMQLYFEVNSLKQNMETLIYESQSNFGKNMEHGWKKEEEARIVAKLNTALSKLNMVLFGQLTTKASKRGLEFLKSALYHMQRGRGPDYICAATYLQIVHYYNIIFAAYFSSAQRSVLIAYWNKYSGQIYNAKRTGKKLELLFHESGPAYAKFIKDLRQLNPSRNTAPHMMHGSKQIIPHSISIINSDQVESQFVIPGENVDKTDHNLHTNLPSAKIQFVIPGENVHKTDHNIHTNLPSAKIQFENNNNKTEYDFRDNSKIQVNRGVVQSQGQRNNLIYIPLNIPSLKNRDLSTVDSHKKTESPCPRTNSPHEKVKNEIKNNSGVKFLGSNSSSGTNIRQMGFPPPTISPKHIFPPIKQAEPSQNIVRYDVFDIQSRNEKIEKKNKEDANGPSIFEIHNKPIIRSNDNPCTGDKQNKIDSNENKGQKKNEESTLPLYLQKRAEENIFPYINLGVQCITQAAKEIQESIKNKNLTLQCIVNFEKLIESELKQTEHLL